MKRELNDIVVNPKYAPLFRKGGTRYYVITGGRGSGKTFGSSLAILHTTYADSFGILYLRYTLTSAETSIIPEFRDKIERMQREAEFYTAGANVTNVTSGAKIYFRGIMTSSGIQTAKLKSIPHVKWVVFDEAEELVDERTFDTIDLSVRDKGADIKVVIILNPPDIYTSNGEEHFIYRRFFKDRQIPDGFTGVVDDTTYIHTTYLENLAHLDDSFLMKAARCKEVDEKKYNNLYLGYWGRMTDGIIYRNWQSCDTFPDYLPTWYGVDWGFTNDPSAVVRVAYDESKKAVYLHEVLYETEMQPMQIADYIRRDILSRRRRIDCNVVCEDEKVYLNGEYIGTIYEDYGEGSNRPEEQKLNDFQRREIGRVSSLFGEVYCDPARPEHIAELRRMGLSALPADNTDKAGRVEYMKYFHVYYTRESRNIEKEQRGYRYKASKIDKTKYTNIPEDGNDHIMDASNYACATHLRRLGVTNILNEK